MKTIATLILTSALAVSAAFGETEAERNLKAFPPAEDGMKRFVLMMPPAADESDLKVELRIGKTVMADPVNRFFFGGQVKAVNVDGWGFTRYVLENVGPMAGTRIGVGPDVADVERFVEVNHDLGLLRYNSRLPIVVYVPEDFEVHARIWRADAGVEVVPEG